jgi:cytochrome P450
MATQLTGAIRSAHASLTSVRLKLTLTSVGPEFRYQPDAVCINTPTAYRHIYGVRGNTTKSESYKIWRKTIDALNTWNSTSNEIHARKRRVLNYAFSEPALRSAEPFIHSNVDRWIELLGQQERKDHEWTDKIDMAHQITYLVFDILGDLCFGRSFNMKEPGNESRYIPGVLSGYLEIMQPVRNNSSFRYLLITD